MANERKHAQEMRTGPKQRQNAQGDHEGAAHSPDEFGARNPQKQVHGTEKHAKREKDPSDDR